MRTELAKHLDHDPHFEWRGQSVTRLENLSDIVFALALGMLLLTGAPPATFDELIELGHWLRGAGGSAGFDAFTVPGEQLEASAVAKDIAQAKQQIDEIRDLAGRIQIGPPSPPTFSSTKRKTNHD